MKTTNPDKSLRDELITLDYRKLEEMSTALKTIDYEELSYLEKM
jgi:hypothetical protein